MGTTETLELTRLDELLISGSIRAHADEIDSILSEMEDIPDEIANRVKTLVQTEAYANWKRNNCWGLVAAATGVGKSKIAIMAAQAEAAVNKPCRILIAVPTEKLRDENWEDEFRKWELIRLYNKNVTRVCHVSMNKIHDEDFDLVIMDKALSI